MTHYSGITIYGATLDTTAVGPQADYPLPTREYKLIRTSDNAAAVISSSSAGTVFIFEAGLHNACKEVRPKNGMKFFGQKGAVLDGGNKLAHCFIADTSAGGAGCTLANLEIRNYTGGAKQDACIKLQDAAGGWLAVYKRTAHKASDGWLLENLYVHDNGFVGVFIGGHTTVRKCHIAYNGQVGLKACGYNSIIESNYINNNNKTNFEAGWEAGATKIWCAENLTVHNNIFLDNNGPGIWLDHNYDGHHVHHNTIIGNADAGINFEMVCGKNDWYELHLNRNQKIPVIEYNLIKWNGWSKAGCTMKSFPELKDTIYAFWSTQFWKERNPDSDWLYGGFHCHNGGPVIFRNNKLHGNFGGVVLQYQKRGGIDPRLQMGGSTKGPTGTLIGVQIINNIFEESCGYSGFHFVSTQEWEPRVEIAVSDFLPERDGSIFASNTYALPSSLAYFKYAYANGKANPGMNDYFEKPLLTLEQWKKIAGQEKGKAG
jgi:hypothetical protein